MSRPSRPVHSGTFLITTTTLGRRPFFQVDATAHLLIQTLQRYRHEGQFQLHAFVVMPEHVHLLLTPNHAAVERVVGMIKGGFSHDVPGLKPFWQRGFDDRRARDREEFLAMRSYVHQNPVKRRLCARAEDWPWSSAWSGWHTKADPGAKAPFVGALDGPAEAGP